MSWEYFLDPRPRGACFTKEALDWMRAYWQAHPIYTRSDGVIALCENSEYRDWVLSVGTKDQFDANVEVIAIREDRVVLGVMGWQDRVDALYAFVVSSQSRWSCELLDQRESPLSADQFRAEIRGSYHPPALPDQ